MNQTELKKLKKLHKGFLVQCGFMDNQFMININGSFGCSEKTEAFIFTDKSVAKSVTHGCSRCKIISL